MYNIITSARLSFRLGVPFGESRNSCDFFANTGGYGGKKDNILSKYGSNVLNIENLTLCLLQMATNS